MRTIIIERNPAVLEWLAHKGITGEHVENLTFRDAINNHIYGPAYYNLASVADRISLVRMPRLSQEDYNRYINGLMTPDELDANGAHIRTYKVTQLSGPSF